MHVTVHDENDGNERADTLVKRGTELRFKLMGLQSPGWFQTTLTLYWSFKHRKITNLNVNVITR